MTPKRWFKSDCSGGKESEVERGEAEVLPDKKFTQKEEVSHFPVRKEYTPTDTSAPTDPRLLVQPSQQQKKQKSTTQSCQDSMSSKRRKEEKQEDY